MQSERLFLDIPAEHYHQLRTRELGNHHIHSKKTNSQKWNDVRLKSLEPQLFINKTVLDIGCNEGVLTIPIALKFRPQLIKGVDIDKSLLQKFQRNLQKFTEKNQANVLPKQIIDKISELPLYFQEKLEKNILKNTSEVVTIIPKIQIKQTEQIIQFPKNIITQILNILSPQKVQFYDTILCMDVTKWIHLTFGDQGIKRLFGNISSMLHQGGILILQAQPWKSYRKKKNLQKIYRINYQRIIHKPQKFKDVLRSLGMCLKETIRADNENKLKHDIQIYQKKGFYSSDANL